MIIKSFMKQNCPVNTTYTELQDIHSWDLNSDFYQKTLFLPLMTFSKKLKLHLAKPNPKLALCSFAIWFLSSFDLDDS